MRSVVPVYVGYMFKMGGINNACKAMYCVKKIAANYGIIVCLMIAVPF
jgi:hypothetical protein